MNQLKNCKSVQSNLAQTNFPKLTWADFSAQPDKNSRFHAYSYWKINYSYTYTISSEKVLVNVKTKCIFEKERSWVKPEFMTQELLEHEQGHYYIGCLCALAFKKRVKEAVLSKTTFKSKIKEIFDQTLEEFLKLEEIYDQETCHFYNQEKQKIWDKKLDRKIQNLVFYW